MCLELLPNVFTVHNKTIMLTRIWKLHTLWKILIWILCLTKGIELIIKGKTIYVFPEEEPRFIGRTHTFIEICQSDYQNFRFLVWADKGEVWE